jgi:YhcG PDDEXK nuclease domain
VRRIAVEVRARRTRGGTGLDARFPPGEDDPIVDQLKGNSEITPARCAENGIKADDDKLTIGLLLCRTQNRLVAEYALSGIDKPIGVAEYQLVRALPQPLDTSLPSIEEIEAELSRDLGEEEQR